MCGIFACLGCVEGHQHLKSKLLKSLEHRGPDFTGDVVVPISECKELYLLGTLLRMRGEVTPQPFTTSDNCEISSPSGVQVGIAQCFKGADYLLWNGNIFGGEVLVTEGENDTVKVFERLKDASEDNSILLTLSKVHGPWAFAYWQDCTKSLWFGRDVFGRRSLVWHLPTSADSTFALSSVGCCDQDSMASSYWQEVPASCVYQLVCGPISSQPFQLLCYPWMQSGNCYQNESNLIEELFSLNICAKITVQKDSQLQVPFPPLNKVLPLPSAKAPVGEEEGELLPPPSAKAGEEGELNKVLPPPSVKAPVGGEEGAHVLNLDDSCEPEKKQMDILGGPVDWNHRAKDFLKVLAEAVKVRVLNAPYSPSPLCEGFKSEGASSHVPDCDPAMESACVTSSELVLGRARVGVLYSGGVDSVVLAALVDRCLPSSEEIDLINVAFEERKSSSNSALFAVPDRLSAIESLKELNPNRKWNLIQVDVTAGEVNAMRVECVSRLIYPLCTVLDDSIGCALWFGARGRGTLYGPVETTPYLSRARTLLIGIGADEQLGGYSRHRSKYRSEGWEGLLEEIEKDTKRLAQRNLGRDDRCVADHHRDGQFPFLDEDVVAYLQQLPIWNKVDLSLPRGVGEKRLLREVAMLLGCCSASKLPKRAIQFGSRIAKLSGSSGGRESGSDVCSRLISVSLS